jgi:hypothetical protein
VVSAGMMASFTSGFRKVTKAPVLAVLAVVWAEKLCMCLRVECGHWWVRGLFPRTGQRKLSSKRIRWRDKISVSKTESYDGRLFLIPTFGNGCSYNSTLKFLHFSDTSDNCLFCFTLKRLL